MGNGISAITGIMNDTTADKAPSAYRQSKLVLPKTSSILYDVKTNDKINFPFGPNNTSFLNVQTFVTDSGKVLQFVYNDKGSSMFRYETDNGVFSGWFNNIGPKGDKGATGDKGLTGDKGTTGERGAVGPQGLQGLLGPVGPQGNVGAVGPQGVKGDVGAVGPVGPLGPQGIGIQGIQGIKGDVGGSLMAGSATTFQMESTNNVIRLGNTEYRINNNGTINMDKVYGNMISTGNDGTVGGATTSTPGIYITNKNLATDVALGAVWKGGLPNSSEISNITVAPYNSLVVTGNKSAGGNRRQIQLYDDVTLPMGSLRTTTSICAGSFCIGPNMTDDLSELKIALTATNINDAMYNFSPTFTDYNGAGYDKPPAFWKAMKPKYHAYYSVLPNSTPNDAVNYIITKTFLPIGSKYMRQISHPYFITSYVYNPSGLYIRSENDDGDWDAWVRPSKFVSVDRPNQIDIVRAGADVNGLTMGASGTILGGGSVCTLKKALAIANSNASVKGFVYYPATPAVPTAAQLTADPTLVKQNFVGEAGNGQGRVWFISSPPFFALVAKESIPTTASGTNIYISPPANGSSLYLKSGSSVGPTGAMILDFSR